MTGPFVTYAQYDLAKQSFASQDGSLSMVYSKNVFSNSTAPWFILPINSSSGLPANNTPTPFKPLRLGSTELYQQIERGEENLLWTFNAIQDLSGPMLVASLAVHSPGVTPPVGVLILGSSVGIVNRFLLQDTIEGCVMYIGSSEGFLVATSTGVATSTPTGEGRLQQFVNATDVEDATIAGVARYLEREFGLPALVAGNYSLSNVDVVGRVWYVSSMGFAVDNLKLPPSPQPMAGENPLTLTHHLADGWWGTVDHEMEAVPLCVPSPLCPILTHQYLAMILPRTSAMGVMDQEIEMMISFTSCTSPTAPNPLHPSPPFSPTHQYLVIILPRTSIMGTVDHEMETMIIVTSCVAVGLLLLGWVVVIFLTLYVDTRMRPKEELQRQKEETQRAQAASEVKSQFLANISHDLRTPMAGILHLLDIMLCDHLTAEQEANLRQMKSGAGSQSEADEVVLCIAPRAAEQPVGPRQGGGGPHAAGGAAALCSPPSHPLPPSIHHTPISSLPVPPASSILGLLDIMLCDHLTAEQEANLRQMKSCCASLLGLLNNLLDLAKVEAGRMQLEVLEFDIVGELESLVDMFSVQGLSNGTEIALDLSDDIERTVKGDPSRVRQLEVLEFDIVGELKSLVDMFSVHELSSGTEIALDLSDDIERTVKGDPSRVRQVRGGPGRAVVDWGV
ncbi:unnamed protein product [Closterium sp. NIES-53]